MKGRPIVSTLTSCYRGEKYLPLFLEQMPKQEAFDRLEVVIDLNTPTVEELHVVRKFQERYPDHLRYTVQDQVVTYSTSWNNCIRNSTGDYLAVWNIDDLRTPDSIAKQARLLDERPDIGIVHGKYMVVPQFGATEGFFKNDKALDPREATNRFIFGPFYMFRRSLLDRAGLVDEQFRSSADFEHSFRLAMHARSDRVEGNLGYYLMANTGLSNNPNSRIDIENFVIRMRYGIYDRMWYHYLAAASEYDYHKVLNGTTWTPVSQYVPDYRALLERRYRSRFDRGYLRHLAFKLKKENFSGIRGLLGGLWNDD
ncbi:MAG: glycosyltransferase [Methanomassiliicoccus sp.]|nr:glycosyltransferase [Methanomassiliicoccus sp.]